MLRTPTTPDDCRQSVNSIRCSKRGGGIPGGSKPHDLQELSLGAASDRMNFSSNHIYGASAALWLLLQNRQANLHL